MSRYPLLFFLLMPFAMRSIGQINVGSARLPRKEAGEITRENMERLKGTTTILFVRPLEAAYLEHIQSELSKFWTVTPIEAHQTKDWDKYLGDAADKKAYSYITITYDLSSDNFGNYFRPYLCLWMRGEDNKKGKPVQILYACIELYASGELVRQVSGVGNATDDPMSRMYNEDLVYNLGDGLLLNYLKVVHSGLVSAHKRWAGDEERDHPQLMKMKRDTLFVLDNALLRMSIYTGKEEAEPAEKIMEDYPSKYKMISRARLNDMLRERATPFYYLVFVRTDRAKFINVYRSDTGEVIYSAPDTSSRSPNLRDGDIKDLAKACESGR